MTKKDIERFFAGKFRTYRAQKTMLRVSKNNSNFVRKSFMVSSVVKKNAVARNKTRRRMTEIVRSMNLLPGHDFVFSLKLEEKKPYSFKFLEEEIKKLLRLCGAL